MTTNARFTVLDDLSRVDHALLVPADQIGYLFEWTKGQDFRANKVSQLIENIKKKPSSSSANELRYKERDIAHCSQWLHDATSNDWIEQGTFVPVPPSKIPTNPDYCDRMERICRGMNNVVDVRNLVQQSVSVVPTHERPEGQRYSPAELLEIWSIDESLSNPLPTRIAIVDDMLTAGAHYRAMHTLLSGRFPNAQIIGLFIARRIFAVAGDTD
ncbi:hypothetical protein [uncultured Roseovarius sp.]|uniref:hypothetical protein n=1 Tax=uncultured Roseovarius sp. TaxID=293344 RepID=UPI002606808C|nr:hypothetical protein [uncultured Roseovarius sp.]